MSQILYNLLTFEGGSNIMKAVVYININLKTNVFPRVSRDGFIEYNRKNAFFKQAFLLMF